MESKQDLPIVAFDSQQEWEQWLEVHHATSSGLRLKLAKKGSGIASVSFAEALESALCYGWIDSQSGSYDEQCWLQRFTQRGRKSKWSRANRDKATELLMQGRMKSAGLAHVERAQQDGRWDAAYEGSSSATVPDDLQRELERNPAAQAFFAALDSRNRYAILHRIQDTRKPETRARRIEKYIAMLNAHEKIYP